jgi:long-chain acyl-CoA synthetase
MTNAKEAALADTIPKSFVQAVERWRDRPAIREKDMGIWKTVTWGEWLERSRAIAYSLDAVGFKPGDVASILCNTKPEWVYADMGVLLAGGVSSGIYPTDSARQVEYLVNDSRSRVLFVEDDEQLDKVLEVRGRCPSLEKIIVFDMEGLSHFSDPMVTSLDAFMETGRARIAGREALLDQMLASRGIDDLAILVYTSGTTGPPKGSMHAHRSVLAQMRHAPSLYGSGVGEARLLFLPMCHVAERIGGYYTSIAMGPVMNFAESPETVPDNIREVQPATFLAVPRIWEKFYSATMIALKDATAIEKWAYQKAIGVGYRIADARLEGRNPSMGLRLLNEIGYRLVLRNIRRMLGIDRCRVMFTGAAPISPDLIRWYLALGLNMYEVYGQTENCGVATAMPPEHIKLGTVGKAVPWGEVKISPQGEILIRGEFLSRRRRSRTSSSSRPISRTRWSSATSAPTSPASS